MLLVIKNRRCSCWYFLLHKADKTSVSSILNADFNGIVLDCCIRAVSTASIPYCFVYWAAGNLLVNRNEKCIDLVRNWLQGSQAWWAWTKNAWPLLKTLFVLVLLRYNMLVRSCCTVWILLSGIAAATGRFVLVKKLHSFKKVSNLNSTWIVPIKK